MVVNFLNTFEIHIVRKFSGLLLIGFARLRRTAALALTSRNFNLSR